MKVFLSYAHDDADYRDEALAALKHLKGVEIWHDLQILSGTRWRGELEVQLRGADAAILLVSSAFLGSAYCMEKELPVLLQKRIRLFPVLIRECNWRAHPELREMQFFPPRRRMEPLESLKRFQKNQVWTRLSEELHQSAKEPPRHLLIVKEQREDFVMLLLPADAAPATLRHESLKDLLDAYLELYARKLIEEAQELFTIFKKRADRLGLEVPDPLHREVLDLLEVGLPLKPVHLQDISRLDLESLLSSRGYATLLHGIRLTDIDYEIALPYLQRTKLSQERCSLFAYTEAQCLRKVDRLDEAYETLKDGESFLGNFEDGHCVCGPKCQREVLGLQIHRGFGAVCRNLAKREREAGRNADAARFRREAEKNFKSCLALENEDIPATVRSDIRYSYGYFVFEMAFLDHDQGVSSKDGFRRELRRAEALFKASRDLNRTFAAPRARRAIVRQLLGEPAFYDYLYARKIALREKSGESPLTALLCGFAMLFVEHQRTKNLPRPPESSTLLDELRGLLKERHFSKGPLQCHAFDCRVVRYGRDLEDPALAAVYDLLMEAATWETENLADQKDRLASFLESRGLAP